LKLCHVGKLTSGAGVTSYRLFLLFLKGSLLLFANTKLCCNRLCVKSGNEKRVDESSGRICMDETYTMTSTDQREFDEDYQRQSVNPSLPKYSVGEYTCSPLETSHKLPNQQAFASDGAPFKATEYLTSYSPIQARK
jgi:hypothetical protein